MAVALLVLAVGVGGAVVRQLSQPAVTVLVPEADAYVSTAHPEANYGTCPTLRADATPKISSYLRFRLAELPGRVVRAELRLWSQTGSLAGYMIHPVTSTTWDEDGITAGNRPGARDAVARSGPFGSLSWSSADVTRLVLGTNNVLTVVLTSRSRQNIAFDSREGGHKPELVVWTEPRAPQRTQSARGFRLRKRTAGLIGAQSPESGLPRRLTW